MTYNELHNITDKVVRKDSEAKELKRKYFIAKESFRRGNYMELYPMSVFAKSLAFSYLGKNQIKPAIKILEDIRQAIDDSKDTGMMTVWSEALISIYPMLAFCNMEFSKWKKAEIILSQYVEHLGNLLTLPLWQNGNSSCDKGKEPCGLFSREKVVEDLYQIFEKLCIHDRLVGNDNRAISNMLSIKGIITEYGSQYTQIKLSAFLTKCYDATGDDENFIESYKSFAKTYKRAQMMGASINDGLKSVCDDIFNIAYHKFSQLMSAFKAFKEINNNKGIISISDVFADLCEEQKKGSACYIYHTAFIALAEMEADELGLSEMEFFLLRGYYASLADDCFICRDYSRIRHELIKDFIERDDYQTLFVQQELKTILYDYLHLCYVDIVGYEIYKKLDYIIDNCLRHVHIDRTRLVSLILIKGGDKSDVIKEIKYSSIDISGIKCLYVYLRSLETTPSVRIYFFKKSIEQNKPWRIKLDEAVEKKQSIESL